jgi:preprotein translocase subunit SecD
VLKSAIAGIEGSAEAEESEVHEPKPHLHGTVHHWPDAGLAFWGHQPPKAKLNLGLDHPGCIHPRPQGREPDAVRAETEKDMEALRRRLTESGVPSAQTARKTDTSFESPRSGRAGRRAQQAGQRLSLRPRWDWSRQGGAFLFTMTAANERSIRDMAVNQALQTIRNAIDQFGVSEPVIARQGVDSDRSWSSSRASTTRSASSG